ncbi:MAG: lipopolysaccharide export system permease protein [Hyphomicrobiaceae bacterium]|jgi:lipopolysaccharide export system permease protein
MPAFTAHRRLSTLASAMGKTLRKYFIVEIGGAFLSGLVLFTFILFLVRILSLMDMIFARGVPAGQVAKLFLYIIPTFLELTMPMALLLAVVVAFGRLASDGELTALRAAGVNIYQMLLPGLMFAGLVAAATLALAVWARPWGYRHTEAAVYEIAKTRATAALRPRVFNTDFDDLVIYVDQIDPEGGLLEGIMLSDDRGHSRRTTIFANGGRIVGDDESGTIYLHLIDGTSLSVFRDEESYDWTDFRSLEVNLDINQAAAGTTPAQREPRELDWPDLIATRDTAVAAGGLATAERLEIHRKLALSTAAFVLAILGVPLGMQPSRAVRARGVSISIGIILFYYIMLSTGDAMARRLAVSPAVGMWTPNLVLLIGAAWMFHRAATERFLNPSPLAWIRSMIASRNQPEDLA